MVELLAPAGSMESLQVAIHAGADAIYVGGSRFNARAFATNFDLNQLFEAVKLCHLHGVRLFVTVNTVYKDHEMADLYAYIKALYLLQIDALIVQDEGLMDMIKKHFKDFEVHASTQCSIHNLEGIQHYEKKGIKRVVVARENSLDEIQTMAQGTSCEIEAFVHGALCVAYSGQCYLSQSIGERSANRGQCAQPCRLPYTLYQNDQVFQEKSYLMSCKDLCTIDHLEELIQAGVKSFKIEGRMKRPAYVYAITQSYRQAIDHVQRSYSNRDLAQLFNRDFTDGYLFHEQHITSEIYSGNRGLLLGEVVQYRKGKLSIKALIDVMQGDGIRFGYEDEGKILNKIYLKNQLIHQVSAGEIFEIDYQTPLKKGTKIYRTTSYALEKTLDKACHQLYRRIPITMSLTGKVGGKLFLTISDGHFHVDVSSPESLEKAKQQMNQTRIQEQLAKLGNTIYQAQQIELNLKEDVFIPMSLLNTLRREACATLDDLRQNRRVREEDVVKPYQDDVILPKTLAPYYYQFHTQEQFQAALPLLDKEPCFMDRIEDYLALRPLYPHLGLAVETIASRQVFEEIDTLLKQYPETPLAVNNVGAYERYQKNIALLLPGFNLSHTTSLQQYLIPAVLSLDLNQEEIKALYHKGVSCVNQVYGHFDAMTSKHCPVSVACYHKKIEGCNQCLKGKYFLLDRARAKFPLLFTKHCVTQVLSEHPLKRKLSPSSFLRFTIETEKEVSNIILNYQNKEGCRA